MLLRLPVFLACLCFILAILLPFRFAPMPSFHAEALSFTGLTFAGLYYFVVYPKRAINIPFITLPFLLISIIPLIQYIWGEIYFFERAILPFLYIVSFWIAIILAYNFSQKNEYSNLLKVISIALVIATILSSIVSICQWLNIVYWPLVDNPSGNRFGGNIGQPNHMATLMVMAITASLYLFEKHIIKIKILVGVIFVILWGLVLTQSRTTWLVLPVLAVMWGIYQKNHSTRVRAKHIVLIAVIYFLLAFALPFINQLLTDLGINIVKTSTVAERASSGYLRFVIWDQMLHAIMQKPLLGWGWYQTNVAQFHILPSIAGIEWISSSHNFILDIMVWCGVPLGILIIGYLLYFYIKLIKVSNITGLCALLMIIPVAIHSLLEFPIFYSYFLLPIGLLTGILIAQQSFKFFKIPAFMSIVFFISGSSLIYIVFMDYNIAVDNQRLANDYEMNGRKKSVTLQPNYIFDLQHENSEFTLRYIKRPIDKEKLQYYEKVVSSNFNVFLIYKLAMLYALNNQRAESEKLIKMINNRFDKRMTYEEVLQIAKQQ